MNEKEKKVEESSCGSKKKLLETASNLSLDGIPRKLALSGPVKNSINKDGKVNPDDKTPKK